MAWIPHLMVLDDDPRVLDSLVPSVAYELGRGLAQNIRNPPKQISLSGIFISNPARVFRNCASITVPLISARPPCANVGVDAPRIKHAITTTESR